MFRVIDNLFLSKSINAKVLEHHDSYEFTSKETYIL